MTNEKTVTMKNSFQHILKMVSELVYDKCGFDVTNLKQNAESTEYGACSFVLDGKIIQYRVSKITPTKTGQFVAIWKRNGGGITAPFDSADDLDFLIVTATNGDNLGQFIFPKSVLVKKGIISQNGKGGKRGMRVYPPWDLVTNKQAMKTQSWQTTYFLTITNDHTMNLTQIKQLLAKATEIDR
jgi:hypothetical protein